MRSDPSAPQRIEFPEHVLVKVHRLVRRAFFASPMLTAIVGISAVTLFGALLPYLGDLMIGYPAFGAVVLVGMSFWMHRTFARVRQIEAEIKRRFPEIDRKEL